MDCLSFFDKSFWQQFVATILGAGLGVLGSLWVDRRIRATAAAEEFQKLLVALSRSINKNIGYVNHLLEHFQTGEPTTCTVDLAVLQSSVVNKLLAGFSVECYEAIENARYELAMLNFVMTSKDAIPNPMIASNVRQTYPSHLKRAKVALEKAKQQIEKEPNPDWGGT